MALQRIMHVSRPQGGQVASSGTAALQQYGSDITNVLHVHLRITAELHGSPRRK